MNVSAPLVIRPIAATVLFGFILAQKIIIDGSAPRAICAIR
jgi:hypothetical protein